MAESRHLTALIEREDDGYVALCPEIDVASQGTTIEEARSNLQEAVELFFEVASPQEIEDRYATAARRYNPNGSCSRPCSRQSRHVAGDHSPIGAATLPV